MSAALYGSVHGDFGRALIGTDRDGDALRDPAPATGSVTFTPFYDRVQAGASVVLPQPVKVPLVDGGLAVDLVATFYVVTFSFERVKWDPLTLEVKAGDSIDLVAELIRTGPPTIPPAPTPVTPAPAITFTQTTPQPTWLVTHNLGRLPFVAIYDPAGNLVFADVTASPSAVAISFSVPTAGSAVLT